MFHVTRPELVDAAKRIALKLFRVEQPQVRFRHGGSWWTVRSELTTAEVFCKLVLKSSASDWPNRYAIPTAPGEIPLPQPPPPQPLAGDLHYFIQENDISFVEAYTTVTQAGGDTAVSMNHYPSSGSLRSPPLKVRNKLVKLDNQIRRRSPTPPRVVETPEEEAWILGHLTRRTQP
jgi:hypothetical protein